MMFYRLIIRQYFDFIGVDCLLGKHVSNLLHIYFILYLQIHKMAFLGEICKILVPYIYKNFIVKGITKILSNILNRKSCNKIIQVIISIISNRS